MFRYNKERRDEGMVGTVWMWGITSISWVDKYRLIDRNHSSVSKKLITTKLRVSTQQRKEMREERGRLTDPTFRIDAIRARNSHQLRTIRSYFITIHWSSTPEPAHCRTTPTVCRRRFQVETGHLVASVKAWSGDGTDVETCWTR